MKYFVLVISLIMMSFCLNAQDGGPFKWSYKLNDENLTINAEIPAGHYLYKSAVNLTLTDAKGDVLKASKVPETVDHTDSSGIKQKIYAAGEKSWQFDGLGKGPYTLKINFQGCKGKTATSSEMCFFPGSKTFEIKPDSKPVANDGKEKPADSVKSKAAAEIAGLLKGFRFRASSTGMMNPKEFIAFLKGKQEKDLFADKSTLLVLVLIILGGLGLNLTPCVLPMIPINLAIIGAGMKSDSRLNGFIRGGVYGVGIAVAYGALGLFAVLTGAQFGSLNSNWIFNLVIAVIFLLLGLAMFDVFSIDFSRFSAKIGPKNSDNGKLIPVFLLGVVAALLAGACVAPVVIAVLLYSSGLYAGGNYSGLLLPFLLGVGMGLPWPLAGAGMSVMPKPGKWMMTVKYVFGVFIILFGVYYGYFAYSLAPFGAEKANQEADSVKELKNTLVRAKENGKPVFVDVWATWCKTCVTMNKTTFKDAEVKQVLADFEVVKFQAEDPGAPEIKPILESLKLVGGLPYYVILEPEQN